MRHDKHIWAAIAGALTAALAVAAAFLGVYAIFIALLTGM